MNNFQNFSSHLMDGNTENVRGTLRKEFVNMPVDNKGRVPIHIACDKQFVNIVILLLSHNCNIECEDSWGYRPIHYAALNGNIEIVKLLLQNNCKTDCRTKGWFGQTPLDIAKKWSTIDCVQLLETKNLIAAIKQNDPIKFNELAKECNFMSEKLYTGLTVLETAIENNADKIIKSIIDRPVNNKEINQLNEITTANFKYPDLLKECFLYRCIVHEHGKGFKKFNNSDIINGERKIARQSFLEIAAEVGCDLFVNEIMKKTIYEQSIWLKAIKKAKENKFMEIHLEISERMNLLESRNKVSFTILHSAVCDNDANMVKYILDHPNIIDLNSNNDTLGTALALAHSLHHRKCIRMLQQYQLDTNTLNKYSQTPLHEAIASGVVDNCEYLINRSIDIDQTGFMGLTGLHCAAIKGMADVCAQLVNRGADYMRKIALDCQSTENKIAIPFEKSIISLSLAENALTLSMKFHGSLFPCFLNQLNSTTSNVHDGDNNSLLHMAVICLHVELCIALLDAGAKVDSINNNGNSPLLEMFSKSHYNLTNSKVNKMIAITNILIKYGADVNFKSANKITVFQSASTIGSERMMLALVSNNSILKNFSSKDFQLAFSSQWFSYAKELINLLSSSFLTSNITKDTFELCKTQPELIKILFQKSSTSFQRAIIENLLYNAITRDDYELFDYFINIEITSPKLLINGENIFTYILKKKKIQFAWKLLESINKMKFVNLKNTRNQIPLQVAININNMDLVDALIHESKEFDVDDVDGRCVLTQLMAKISTCDNINIKSRLIAAIKSAILLGGDIYRTSASGQRIIDACVAGNIKAEIERFHGNNIKKKEIHNEKICMICMNNLVNSAFQCGHLACSACSDKLLVCPVCNAIITTRTKIHFN